MDDLTRFSYTFGIEEEFFLAHPKSRSLAVEVPRSFLSACRRRFGNAIAPEPLWSQIEIVSPAFERAERARGDRNVRPNQGTRRARGCCGDRAWWAEGRKPQALE